MTEPDGRDIETLDGDAELITRVRAGNTGAYATLYERHAAAARGLARQLLRGDAEVDDAVAEAFTRVLGVIQRGGGPKGSFRPYLLTSVRNAAYDRGRGDKRHVVVEDMESVAPGEPFVDPALEGLERSLIARAFLSLPERWQSVLWHVEIEGSRPAEVAPLLGMKANGVAALAYRAREGLRQAYLQMHLAGGAVPSECRPTIGLLGGYVRAALSKRDTGKVDAHLDDCADCRAVYAELMDVNVGLRGIVLPLFVGSAATGYLASGAGVVSGAASGGVVEGSWWSRVPRRGKQVTAGGVAAAGVALATALALVGVQEPLVEEDPPPVAAPDQPAAEDPPGAPDVPSDDEPDAPEAPAPDDPAPEEPAPEEPPSESDPATPDEPPASEEPEAPEEPEDPEQEEMLPPADIPEEELPVDEESPAFAVGFDPVGDLLPGSDGIMVLDVRNVGQDAGEEIVATFTLPPGVETISGGTGTGYTVPMLSGNGAWSCSAQGGGGTCVLPGMTAGENATQFLDVRATQDADVGVPGSVTVTSGEITSSATGEQGVSAEGVVARYATAGRVTTENVGNALMTCVEPGRPGAPWPWPERPGPGLPAPGWPDPGLPNPGLPSPVLPGVEYALPEDDADLSRAPQEGDALPEPVPEEPPEEDGIDAPEGAEEVPDEEGSELDHSYPEEGHQEGEPESGAEDTPEEPESEGDRGGDHHKDGPCADAQQREGDARDNDNWVMAPLDRDWDPSTAASSSATWEMPEGGSVRWAGLYFSGAATPETPSARVKGPGMTSYETVVAAESSIVDLPAYSAYQAFAEVTEVVRAHGDGEWWVADVPMREGHGVYAGWSLVVVLEDPALGSYNQVMVLDEAATVFQNTEGVGFPVSGLLPASVPARVGVTAWEGDADLGGDRVTVDGSAVAPVSGHGTVDNAFVSSARGAVGDPFTFGTDVAGFDAVVGRETDIRIHSEQDAVFVGVVSLVASMRT